MRQWHYWTTLEAWQIRVLYRPDHQRLHGRGDCCGHGFSAIREECAALPVPLGVADTVEPDCMHLVEVNHRGEALGNVAELADRRDVAVHRVDRLETHQLRPLGRRPLQQARE